MAGGRKRVQKEHNKYGAIKKAPVAAPVAAASKPLSQTGNFKGAYGAAKKVASDYLRPDTASAAANFDYSKSAKERQESAAAKKRIAEASVNQRVSGRKKSRANELAAIHGRTDEEKIQSKAVSERNAKLVRDAAAFVAPGGALGAATAKVGYAKKAFKAGKHVLGAARKLGAGSVKAGIKKGAATVAKRVAQKGVKGSAKYAAKQGVKFAKYKGKIAAKGAANEAVQSGSIG